MTNNDLIDALRNQSRQPVDLNLGQVPVSPTIGRMGNYNVVVPGYSTQNAATELSSALAQFPQILGQARNIQEQAGKQAANELTTEQVIARVNAGDFEAQGFLTQFGKDKAFAEQVYQRWFDSSIKPSLINASSELDNKSPEELLQMGEGEAFEEQAKAILVNSLTNNDPSILEKIADNPYTASLHNKAMEAVIPEFVAKASATATARRKEFTRQSTIDQAGDDFLSRTNVKLSEYVPDDTKSDEWNEQQAEKHRTDGRAALVGTFQSGFDTETEKAKSAGLTGKDLREVQANLIRSFRSQIALLIEQDDIDEATALYTAMDDGTLKVDGKTFRQFKDGVDTLTRTEAMIEQYEEDLKSENNRKDIDQNKLASFSIDNIDSISGPVIENPDTSPQDYDTASDKLRILRTEVRERRKDLTAAEQELVIKDIDDEIADLKARKEGRIDELNIIETSPMYARFIGESGLGGDKFKLKQTTADDATLIKRADEYGIRDQYEYLVNTAVDPASGKSSRTQDPDLLTIPESAHKEALKEALGTRFRAFKNGRLELTDELKEQIKKDYDAAYQEELTNRIKDLAKIREYVEGGPTTTSTTPAEELPPDVLQADRRARLNEAGYPLTKDGKLTYQEQSSSFGSTLADPYGFSQTYVQRSVDTDNAWKMVQDPEAVQEFRASNTEAARLEFNQTWLKTKYSEYAKRRRAQLIYEKDTSLQRAARLWEVHQSRSTGLPMEILRTNQGLSRSYALRSEGFFAQPTKIPTAINYGTDLRKPDAPETRIFNVNAVYKAVRKNDFEDLIFIATEYGHAPEGSTAESPEIQSFLNKQKTVIERYGFMDFKKPDTEKDTDEQE